MVNGIADRIVKLDCLEQTWNGVVQRLQQVFSKQSKITNKDISVVPALDMDDLEFLQQQKNQILELPLIGVAPVQIEADINSYNSMMLRKEGFPITYDKDRANWIVPKLSPVLASFQVLFVTDDVLTLMRIIDRWTSFDNWTFDVAFSNWKMKIQLQVEKNLQVPPRQLNSGAARQFRLAATMQAKTYSGHIWFVPSIRKVELESYIPKQGTIADALENPAVMAQVVNIQTIVSDPYISPLDFEPKA